MPPTPEQVALRTGVAWMRLEHVHMLWVSGSDAFDLLDDVLPAPIYLRPGQVGQTFLLDDEGRPVADLEIVAFDDQFLLLSDGLSAEALAERLLDDASEPWTVTLTPMNDHLLWSTHGPFAWEVLADLCGDATLGMPYLSSFELRRWEGHCIRAGKTGEYGYIFAVAPTSAEAFLAAVEPVLARYEAVALSQADLDLAALEAGFFSIRHHLGRVPDAAELQLLWRLRWDRTFRGKEALAAGRIASGVRLPQVVCVGLPALAAMPATGCPVLQQGKKVGEVLYATHSGVRGHPVVLVQLEQIDGWPGQTAQIDGVEATVLQVPLLNNRSLHVDLQRHAWADRDRTDFPPLVLP